MKNNKQILEDYKSDRSNDKNLTETTIENQHVVLTKFSEVVNKPFKAITKNDLKEYLTNYKSSSQDLRIVVIKRFYTWMYNGKMPDWLQSFKARGLRAKEREGGLINNREKVITPEEYQKMSNACLHLQHKAILETLYVYGCRAGELVSMNATDVDEDEDLCTITVRISKTKAREIPSKEDPQYLLDWFTTYQPYKEQEDKPLWVTGCNRTQGQRLSRRGVLQIVKRAAKRAGITRNITAHYFRHTAITRDSPNMTRSLLEVKYGLVHGSAVIRTYDHTQTEELKQFLRDENITHPKDTYRNLKREKETTMKKHQAQIKTMEKQMQDFQMELLEMKLTQVQDLQRKEKKQNK